MMGSNIINASHIQKFINNIKGFEKVLSKLKIITASNGKCEAELTVDEDHTNVMGTLHGGLTATLVDSVSSYALLTVENGNSPSVSVDIHMTYIKGAKLGETIIIDANTIKAGKSLAFLEVFIKNKTTNELLAKGSHTKYLLKPKS